MRFAYSARVPSRHRSFLLLRLLRVTIIAAG